MDFVPNHTSNESVWFEKSVNKEDGYEDYYIWADAKLDKKGMRMPPNNWVSGQLQQWNFFWNCFLLRNNLITDKIVVLLDSNLYFTALHGHGMRSAVNTICTSLRQLSQI